MRKLYIKICLLMMIPQLVCAGGFIDASTMVFGVKDDLKGFLVLFSHGSGDFRIDEYAYKTSSKTYEFKNVHNFDVPFALKPDAKVTKVKAEMEKATKRPGFKMGQVVELPVSYKEIPVYGGSDGTFSVPFSSTADKDTLYLVQGEIKKNKVNQLQLIKRKSGKNLKSLSLKIQPENNVEDLHALRIRLFYHQKSKKIIGLFQGLMASQYFVTKSL